MDKLEIHLRCHSSDRPFKCDLCEKTYKDQTALLYHKKSHTGNSERYLLLSFAIASEFFFSLGAFELKFDVH